MRIFFSYSHKDEIHRERLVVALAALKREGKISGWHDRMIVAGQHWAREIESELEAADVVLLLVSPDFIASDFCYENEMARALERHESGTAQVVPIILRPTDWQRMPFAHLQALPRDGKAINTWPNVDEAWLDVSEGIRVLVEKPSYPDPETQSLSEALEQAFEQRALLEDRGDDISEINETIVDLKRRLRADGHLKEGDTLADRYRLHALIGQGGFAQVWKAYDRQRRKLVAVKVLHTQYGRDKTRRDRFFRGAHQMMRLREHPGIVDVLEEKCQDGGYHFFVMEYLSDGDFRCAVLDGKLSAEERLQIVIDVGEALAYAHEQGIIHRDVKPANILLTADGKAKLTDFDLVRAADSTGGTRTAGMLGTFLYAAPEALLDAKTVDERADVYGLGMTAMFALSGSELTIAAFYDPVSTANQLDTNDACRQVLARAVARSRDERWETIRAFVEALRDARQPYSSETQVVREVDPPKPLNERRPVLGNERQPAERSEIEWVHVPGDVYRLGSDSISGEEKPVHNVTLTEFWIAKHPVTNEQYQRFVDATDHRQPLFWDDSRFNDPRQPVVGVSWLDALAFAQWAGVELPSEAQWEATARGRDERTYPWGSESPTDELADFGKDYQTGQPSPVGSFPQGAGPFGAMDQAGGVWEWCRDSWDAAAYRNRDGKKDPEVPGDDTAMAADRVVRGGSWAYPARDLPAAVRGRSGAGDRLRLIGFRVLCRFRPEHVES